MTHPLTDEIIDKITVDGQQYCYPYDENDMRAAADWQLEQVIDAWENAWQSDLEHGVKCLSEESAKNLAANYPKIFAFGEVLAAMRPQQQQDN